MTLTPEQIEAALNTRRHRVTAKNTLTPEERARRAAASSKAAGQARVALARVYREDYNALYQAALTRCLAETDPTTQGDPQ